MSAIQTDSPLINSTENSAASPPASSGPLFAASASDRRDFAAQLRSMTIGCRLRHERLGVRKALTRDQTGRAAQTFGADARSISARKLLIDTSNPSYRSVINVRSRATHYWKAVTVPYPEPGVRLIRRSFIGDFVKEMERYRGELIEAAKVLQLQYAELRIEAAQRLGDLFNGDDYPARIDTQFEMEWDFPSMEPPAYLKNLHPELYERECQRMRGRFEEAVRLTEQALASKFHEMVAHLVERLSGGVDGKAKFFKDSSIENLSAFFDEFRKLDLGSNEDLGKLVDQAQSAIKGLKPDDLRASENLRNQLGAELSKVLESAGAMMITRPSRAFYLEENANGEPSAVEVTE